MLIKLKTLYDRLRWGGLEKRLQREQEELVKVKARLEIARTAGVDVSFMENILVFGGSPDFVGRLLRQKGY